MGNMKLVCVCVIWTSVTLNAQADGANGDPHVVENNAVGAIVTAEGAIGGNGGLGGGGSPSGQNGLPGRIL